MSTTPEASLDFRNTNSLWCSVLVESLVQLGLRQVVISPGSRSAPLTFAFARHARVEAIPVLDERSAGFFALGLAKQRHHPVALVCTSGTAAANFLPAIVEAHESGVPLLVLTADRPPELRDCHSGQTIDQQKLYGRYVNFYHELAVPEATLPLLRYLRQTVAHAWERTQWPGPAPVHLNAPFRDPLPPVEDGKAASFKKKIGSKFFSHFSPDRAVVTFSAVVELPAVERGLIVAGAIQPADPGRFTQLVEQLAHKTGWPVLANGLSPLRSFDAPGQPFVTSYDLLGRNGEFTKGRRPDFVLSLGGWPTSKPLRAWLEQIDVPTWLVTESPANHDALHGRTRVIRTALESFVEAQPEREIAGRYCADWTGADALMRTEVGGQLAGVDWMFEGKVAWTLPTLLPDETPVFVANSMPVRDVEYFWPANPRGHTLYFNRGANGIDGTLSTAFGVAHGCERPAVLLTGDLALLHDTNGFLSVPKFKGSLTVVLINNNGGGIFEHLTVAKFEPPFEEFFATPQNIDFKKLCATYGVGHTVVKDWKHFAKLVTKLPRRGVRVLELRTDRKRDAAFRQGSWGYKV